MVDERVLFIDIIRRSSFLNLIFLFSDFKVKVLELLEGVEAALVGGINASNNLADYYSPDTSDPACIYPSDGAEHCGISSKGGVLFYITVIVVYKR